MTEDTPPESDRIEGAPHPRETTSLFGQDHAQRAFLDALNTGRVHHGWLLTGPRGVGKATLAWAIARKLLAGETDTSQSLLGGPDAVTHRLDVPDDHPVVRRMRAGAEPRVFLMRRQWDEKAKRLRAQITVDEARKLKNFFALSAADGGHRVAIIDAADEMNVNAANAILKTLEEPPAAVTLLLIAHQPSRLLPTIRSRCRTLRLDPLSGSDLNRALTQAGFTDAVAPQDAAALTELAQGSVGDAIRLIQADGLAYYRELAALFETFPRYDRQKAIALSETIAARGSESSVDMKFTLLDRLLTRIAKTGATGQPPATLLYPNEGTMLMRLAPGVAQARRWAEIAERSGARIRHGRAVNLDPATLFLDTVFSCEAASA